MAFYNISYDMQQLFLQDFSNNTKWFIFLVLIGLSILYVFLIHPRQEKTIYWIVAVRRIFFYLGGMSYLLVSPYTILTMSPEYSFFDFMLLPLAVYSVLLSILILACFIDLIKYGVPVLLRYANMDYNDPNVSKVMNMIKNNKFLPK